MLCVSQIELWEVVYEILMGKAPARVLVQDLSRWKLHVCSGNWKLPEEWAWCVWNLETLSEEQASCAFWAFESSKKNKLHVHFGTLKSLRRTSFMYSLRPWKVYRKIFFMCIPKVWKLSQKQASCVFKNLQACVITKNCKNVLSI
jgi:hypothetical protein